MEIMSSYKIYAIIVAAGKGRRMHNDIPKQLLRYGSKTILEQTLEAFTAHPSVDEIVLVSPQDGSLDDIYSEILKRICAKPSHIVKGGKERGDSVQAALEYLKEQGADSEAIVMIHDAARPGVSAEIIDRNLEAMELADVEAVVTCVPSVDSVRMLVEESAVSEESNQFNQSNQSKESTESLKKSIAYPIMKSNVVERRLIYNVQTPQTFRLGAISLAYEKAKAAGYVGTDDASIADFAGINVAIVEGSPENFKITTAKDIPMTTRVGTGYDVHRLVPDRDLILCGTPVPNDKGLLGHSDADVATHALMDALLGAAGKGDIGIHFPDSDEKYRGANSLKLLAEVKSIIGACTINNVDITIICQRPKLAPYMDSMANNISVTLGIPRSCVNVKATTTEGLGFTGEGEGIAAIASCAICL